MAELRTEDRTRIEHGNGNDAARSETVVVVRFIEDEEEIWLPLAINTKYIGRILLASVRRAAEAYATEVCRTAT
jgi:hypothetical protein